MNLRLRNFIIILIIFLVSGTTFTIVLPPKSVNAGETGTSVTVKFTVQETASGTVDQIEGGEVELATETGATVSVSFSPEALTTSTNISIDSISETNVASTAPIPSGLNVVSDLVYDFKAEADGQTITTFDRPVTLTFTYTDAQISGLDESSVRIYYWDTTQEDWIIFSDYTLDTANNVITINTNHFTLFAIMASSPPSGGGGGYYCSNSPPQITSEAITTTTVDTEYTYQVEATDPNQNTLIYSLSQKPDGMEINATSGVITWVPSSEQVGEHEVAVVVDDHRCGTHTDTQSFTITVSGRLVKTTDTPGVYLIKEGKKRPIPSPEIFNSWGYGWDDIIIITQQEMDAYPLGEPIPMKEQAYAGADFNLDGKVDLIDFGTLVYFWGSTAPANPRVDVNADGVVDLIDFGILIFYWTDKKL